MSEPALHRLPLEGLDALIVRLRGDGYTVIGPTVRDGAIRMAEITGDEDLPSGWTDEQDGAATGCAAARMRRASATSSAPTR